MDRPDVIQLEGMGEQTACYRELRAGRSKTVVAMDVPSTFRWSIEIPDTVAGRLRPDVGTVVSAGFGVPLKPGDRVAVSPYDGKWVTGMGDGEVRFFGTVSTNGESNPVPWYESVPIKMTKESVDPESLTPLGKNVLIKRPKKVATVGGIHLPDAEKYRDNVAQIISVGEQVQEAKPGQWWVYHAGGLMTFDSEDSAYALILEENLYAEVVGYEPNDSGTT